MNVLTILARHGVQKFGTADRDIARLFARQTPAVHHDILIVDNTLPPGHVATLSNGVELIGADENGREFGSWDDALIHARPRLDEYNIINIATAAFNEHYNKYLTRFDERMLQITAELPIAVGHVDAYPYTISSFGFQSQHWLRTSFILVAPRELLLLGSLLHVTRQPGLFSGNPHDPFCIDAPISQGYRTLITDWLTSDRGTGQGVNWHSRFNLTPESLALFEEKTLAILNEHMFSIRLRRQGCRLIDQTWFATELARRDFQGAVFPGWRYQLAKRDVDKAFPISARFPE